MTKYFKATVTLTQTITLNVAAESEESARQQARMSVMDKVPHAQVAHIELLCDGESEFSVGTKIRHRIFGEGEILELARSGGACDSLGFRATIRFMSGSTKYIHLPLPKDTLEVLAL